MHAKFLKCKCAGRSFKARNYISEKYKKLGIAEVYQSRSGMYNYLFNWSNGEVLQVDSDEDDIEIIDDSPPSTKYPLEVAVIVWNCKLNSLLSKIELRCKRCKNITNASVSKYSLLGLLRGEAETCALSQREESYWVRGCSNNLEIENEI